MPDNPGIDRLGFGSAGLTSMRSYGQVKRLLDLAFEAGITHFDTAPLYGQGYSERIMGAFIKGKRDKITIATKFGLGQAPDLKIPFRIALPLNYYKKKWSGNTFVPGRGAEGLLDYRSISLEQVRASLENSLRSLRCGYIDYYFLHEGIPSFLDDKTLAFLLEQKKKGVIRFLGIAAGSNNLRRLGKEELKGWDILQYESGPGSASEDLRSLFPEKLHFFHSCLRHIHQFNPPGVGEAERAGWILANQAKKNESGKTLFFTRRREVLEKNISSFHTYYASSLSK